MYARYMKMGKKKKKLKMEEISKAPPTDHHPNFSNHQFSLRQGYLST